MTAYTKTPPGHLTGAKKVDADSYMPAPGDWEDTIVVHDLGRGWRICDQVSEHDRRLTATLTLTCVTSMIPFMLPFDEDEWRMRIRKRTVETFTGRPGHPTIYEKTHGANFESWLEEKVAEAIRHEEKNRSVSGKPAMRLLHLRDYKNRPRLCILLVLEAALYAWNDARHRCQYHVEYCDSNDFGQLHGFEIDGQMYRLLEARIGTGMHPPKRMEQYIIRWYKEATGKFDEQLYLAARDKRKRWDAYTHNETPADLVRFRRKP